MYFVVDLRWLLVCSLKLLLEICLVYLWFVLCDIVCVKDVYIDCFGYSYFLILNFYRYWYCYLNREKSVMYRVLYKFWKLKKFE